jgi:hypothetical protein
MIISPLSPKRGTWEEQTLLVWLCIIVDVEEQNVWEYSAAPLFSACGGEREGDWGRGGRKRERL